MNNLSKLQSESVKKLKERFIAPPDSDIGWIVRSDINPIFLETVTNKTLKKKLEQFLSDQIQKAVEETRKEMFNTNELDKKWVEHFYESDWHCDTLKETKFEEELKGELTTFLPRHMEVYDWNLPYADMIILIIRNLIKGKKLITGYK